jgi:transcriptional regulator GlxA family with amidase domain
MTKTGNIGPLWQTGKSLMAEPCIAVVAFDRISPFHLSVPCVVFGENSLGGPQFNLRVCAAEPGIIATTAGFSIAPQHDLSALDSADTIIVPSWRDTEEEAPQALLEALVAAAQRGVQVVGLCLGAYVLAQAGLLNGLQATTHWAFAGHFAQRYPEVRVNADVLYVADGNMLTSAGTAAGIDCCLHMVRQQYGSEVANSVARRLVVPPHRQGGQAQYIEQPLPSSARGSRLSGLIEQVRATLAQPHNLDSLAGQALMSRRTFTRQFRLLTGMTVGSWLLQERLTMTQRLLESSDQPVEVIAMLAGFGSAESLRLHFRRTFGVSPQAWRQTFRG